jgi:serine/threonine protein phosphatase PrpC
MIVAPGHGPAVGQLRALSRALPCLAFPLFLLLSQLRVKFRTPQLEHEFGCPYQLGHHRYANSPADAELSTLPVVPGDIIIMGSDGLLDNMSDKEMVQQVGVMC